MELRGHGQLVSMEVNWIMVKWSSICIFNMCDMRNGDFKFGS